MFVGFITVFICFIPLANIGLPSSKRIDQMSIAGVVTGVLVIVTLIAASSSENARYDAELGAWLDTNAEQYCVDVMNELTDNGTNIPDPYDVDLNRASFLRLNISSLGEQSPRVVAGKGHNYYIACYDGGFLVGSPEVEDNIEANRRLDSNWDDDYWVH